MTGLRTNLAAERDFRWRGKEVSRVEALSDCVFALALTLLVVSLEVPRTYGELAEAFVQAPVFAVCFAILAWCWLIHYRFHRRFGLHDLGTTWLDLALLFLILLYVYPLKFLFSFVYNVAILGREIATTDAHGAAASMFEREAQVQHLMWIYGAGFVAIFLTYAALYARAWSKRLELELDSVERVLTKSAIHSHLASAAVGLVSIVVCAVNPRWAGWAGMLYGVLGPLHFVHGSLTRRAVERYRGKVPGAPPVA
jgi:hypothetical protein